MAWQTARPVPHCPNPSMKHNRVAFSISLSLSAPSLPFAWHILARPGCLLITQWGSICSHPRADEWSHNWLSRPFQRIISISVHSFTVDTVSLLTLFPCWHPFCKVLSCLFVCACMCVCVLRNTAISVAYLLDDQCIKFAYNTCLFWAYVFYIPM